MREPGHKMAKHVKLKPFDRQEYKKTLKILKENNLCTVCVEANCPNRYECFSEKTATFMVMGDICTRNCMYCNVSGGTPRPLDPEEPRKIREAVEKMGLKYVVITCVTRDDLPDGGANHFVQVTKELKKLSGCHIELLISDLRGDWEGLNRIVKARPDVLNHNIEVVRDIFPRLRPQGNYQNSLELLKRVKETDRTVVTKSGLMVGLGETQPQIQSTLKDLRSHSCQSLTIGQYLQPTRQHAKVEKFYTEEEFKQLKKIAIDMGFEHVESGQLIRSSYHARQMMD